METSEEIIATIPPAASSAGRKAFVASQAPRTFTREDVVEITPTQDEDVFAFTAIEPKINTIDEEIQVEQDEPAEQIQKIEPTTEASRNMRNRKQKPQPHNDDVEEQILQKETGPEPIIQEVEQRTEIAKSSSPVEEDGLIITQELKGKLRPEEYKFLTETKNLIKVLKDNKGVVRLGDQLVQINYLQIAPQGTPCHDQITKLIANAN